MTWSRLRVAVAMPVALAVGACGGGTDGANDAPADDRMHVVASVYPMAHAAARVGGDRVRVTNLTAVGVEPHDLELTPRQVDQIEDADLVLYLGDDFQPAMAEQTRRRKGPTLDVTGRVPLEEGEGEEEGDRDPHFWLNPVLMSEAVQAVADAMAKAAPADAAGFQANAQRFRQELATLDGEFQQGLAACERKELVTAHAAFHYLATRYGLTQLPIAGLTPEAEPDAARLATLTDEIKAKGITTVFYEELVSPKVAETLAREAGVHTAVLSPLEGLSQEDLDAGKDYAAVMRENLGAIRKALGCR